jgi:hypothetical protein
VCAVGLRAAAARRRQNKVQKKQNGNPEGVALDSRAVATVDAGGASSWGWGEAGGQGDLGLAVIPGNSGNLSFSR